VVQRLLAMHGAASVEEVSQAFRITFGKMAKKEMKNPFWDQHTDTFAQRLAQAVRDDVTAHANGSVSSKGWFEEHMIPWLAKVMEVDFLTGLPNKAAFEKAIGVLLTRSQMVTTKSLHQMVKEQLAERDPPPPSVDCEKQKSTGIGWKEKFLQVYPCSFRYSDSADPGASVRLGEGGKTPSYATTVYKQQPLDHLWTIKVTPGEYLLPQNEEKVDIKLEGPSGKIFLFRGVLVAQCFAVLH
jgi:hypothetical protein